MKEKVTRARFTLTLIRVAEISQLSHPLSLESAVEGYNFRVKGTVNCEQ